MTYQLEKTTLVDLDTKYVHFEPESAGKAGPGGEI